MRFFASLLLLAAGCGDDSDTELDRDRDGFADNVDCDDTDPGVFPGVELACICGAGRIGIRVCQPNGVFTPCRCEESDGGQDAALDEDAGLDGGDAGAAGDGCLDQPTEAECEAPAFMARCAWYLCIDRCLPRGTDPMIACSCGPLDIADCTGACAWYGCGPLCLPRGTATNDACDTSLPPDACLAYGTEPRCSAQGARCQWAAGCNRCISAGLDPTASCTCLRLTDIAACDNPMSPCAWYSCRDACMPEGTAADAVCR
jgi:hypothetical protein